MAGNTCADNKALEKRVAALEKKADKLEKLIVDVAASLKDPSKFIKKAGALDEKSIAKLAQAEAKAYGDKIQQEQIKSMEKMKLDTRLTVLEANVHALMGSRR